MIHTNLSSERAMIPENQMDLPVAFDDAGNFVTPRELLLINKPIATASFDMDQLRSITIKRISMRPDFRIATLKILNSASAVEELQNDTLIGRTLIELELRVIERVFNALNEEFSNASKQPPNYPSRPR